ncbi:MAG: hypothetical protein Q4A42_02950 [Tissierellia bacterium]|nr:hypothetical protein [Tissierellia bacterium]
MKKNKLSLIALILGVISLALISSALFGSRANGDAQKIGEAIGKAIVLPSAICTFVAVLLNAIGYFTVNKTLTLISAIFYVLALVLMPLWGFLGIPSMILQFIAYSKIKKGLD